jgi:hypothetical protein
MDLGDGMNKDFELKKYPQYDSAKLRARINDGIKAVRDETEELDIPQAKIMPFIPVTGSGKDHKYFHNKSPRAY